MEKKRARIAHPAASAPAAAPASTPVSVTNTRESSARTFQRDLYLYWSYARDNVVEITQKGEPRKRALAAIAEILLVPEKLGKGEGELQHPRLRFLRALLQALGALRVDPGGRLAALENGFFTLNPAERVRRACQAWQAAIGFNELQIAPFGPRVHVHPDEWLRPAPEELVAARTRVAGHVRALAAAGWIDVGTLCRRVREHDYELLIPRSAARTYYYRPTHPYWAQLNSLGVEIRDLRQEADGWDLVEAPIILAMVAGPLHWMGLADLGWEHAPDGPPTAFRLTTLGRWLIAGGPQPEIPSEGGRVVVQPNLHIVALDPVHDATLMALDRFAERLRAERAVEYRLTRASVYAGQLAGWDVARIRTFLEEHTGAALPANVARTLDEWQGQHERIVIRRRAAIAHGAPQAIAGLAGQPGVLAQLSPETALLDPAQLPALLEQLSAQDVVPRVLRRGAGVAPGAVQVDERGGLRFDPHTATLYLHGHLEAFAEPDGPDRYALTRASVARAVRAGLDAPQILERLATVHRGPLPDELVRRVRAWAQHYGAATLETTVLLHVRDEQALAELLDDPEVGALIERFVPSTTALARVQPRDVERLRALLLERGVELSS
jgi:hypothetical protein